jgi:hypothetical protein
MSRVSRLRTATCPLPRRRTKKSAPPRHVGGPAAVLRVGTRDCGWFGGQETSGGGALRARACAAAPPARRPWSSAASTAPRRARAASPPRYPPPRPSPAPTAQTVTTSRQAARAERGGRDPSWDRTAHSRSPRRRGRTSPRPTSAARARRHGLSRHSHARAAAPASSRQPPQGPDGSRSSRMASGRLIRGSSAMRQRHRRSGTEFFWGPNWTPLVAGAKASQRAETPALAGLREIAGVGIRTRELRVMSPIGGHRCQGRSNSRFSSIERGGARDPVQAHARRTRSRRPSKLGSL